MTIESFVSNELLARIDACAKPVDVVRFIREGQPSWGRSSKSAMLLSYDEVVTNLKLDSAGFAVRGDSDETFIEDRRELMANRMRIAGIDDGTPPRPNRAWSTCDRLVAALSVLNFEVEPRAGAFEAAQGIVNDILLAHPNLLHPHFVVPHRKSLSALRPSYHSVLTMLLTSRVAMLPSEHAGVSKERVAAFAAAPCLAAAFRNNVPDTAVRHGQNYDSSVDIQEAGNSLESAKHMIGTVRPRMLASILELGCLPPLAESASWPTAPQQAMTTKGLGMAAMDAVWTAAGIGWRDNLLGDNTPRMAYAPLHDAVRRSGLFNKKHLAEKLGDFPAEHIFWGSIDRISANKVNDIPSAVTCADTQAAMQALVRMGLADDMAGAARWFWDELLGGDRPSDRHLPMTGQCGALGMLEALVEAGLALPPQPPVALGKGVNLMVTLAWQDAHANLSRSLAMRATIEGIEAASTANDTPARHSATRRPSL